MNKSQDDDFDGIGDIRYMNVSVSMTPEHIEMIKVIRKHLTVERTERVGVSAAVRECILVFYTNLMKEGKKS